MLEQRKSLSLFVGPEMGLVQTYSMTQRRPHLLQEVVQGLQGGYHSIRVFFCKVQPRSFLQPFVPQLMPQYCNTNQLLTNELSLI
jgi:hypothetical protein